MSLDRICKAEVITTVPDTSIMRARGLRRLPVVDEHRHLLGIVTMDDVLGLLGQEIANLAEAVHLEVAKETIASPHAS